MVTGAESPSASRCALLSTFGALSAVGWGAPTPAPKAGEGRQRIEGKEAQKKGRAPFKSRLQGRNPPFLRAGLGRRELHPTQARSSLSQAPGTVLQTATHPRVAAPGG